MKMVVYWVMWNQKGGEHILRFHFLSLQALWQSQKWSPNSPKLTALKVQSCCPYCLRIVNQNMGIRNHIGMYQQPCIVQMLWFIIFSFKHELSTVRRTVVKNLQIERLWRREILDCFKTLVPNMQFKGWRNFAPLGFSLHGALQDYYCREQIASAWRWFFYKRIFCDVKLVQIQSCSLLKSCYASSFAIFFILRPSSKSDTHFGKQLGRIFY